jgi:hypothetical protein
MEAKVYKVFFLGGQSNMTGYGYVKDLPPDINSTFQNVMIYHGNSNPDCVTDLAKGNWAQLKPGHGEGFTSDGTTNPYSDRFGIELSFAKHLTEL